MPDIILKPDTPVWLTVHTAEASIEAELYDHLSYFVEGYQHMPLYKKGYWDGRKSLFSKLTKRVYRGLAPRVVAWAEACGYTIEDQTGIEKSWTLHQSAALSKSLNIPPEIKIRDYQARCVHYGLHHQNGIIISPTGSGKSIILYHWVRSTDKPVLVIVPLKQLRKQIVNDFREYGWVDVDDHVHEVIGTKSDTTKRVVISTWHSIKDRNVLWFNRFHMVICDEVHHAQATTLVAIMEKCRNTEYRLGCTGTLADAKAHQWVIEGLFGPIYRDKTGGRTHQLQKQGYLSKIQIHRVVLDWRWPDDCVYPKPTKRRKKKVTLEDGTAGFVTEGWSYHDEMKFLAMHAKRNRFLGKLALDRSDQENTLLLFTLVENHGKLLHQWLQDAIGRLGSTKREYFIAGQTPTEDRELFRKLTEAEQGIILTASNGTFSTGINIKNLHNLILGCSTRSEYRILQGIGRGLRTHPTKQILHVFDIVDDWRAACGYDNYTYIHSLIRLAYYKREQFPVSTATITFTA